MHMLFLVKKAVNTCSFTRVRAHTHTHTHTFTSTSVCVHLHTLKHVCTHAHTYVSTHNYACTNTAGSIAGQAGPVLRLPAAEQAYVNVIRRANEAAAANDQSFDLVKEFR